MALSYTHGEHPSHSCVVGCKERGGGLFTVRALTAQGMTIMRSFVVQVIVSTPHGDKQTNKHHMESHTFRRQELSVDPGSS